MTTTLRGVRILDLTRVLAGPFATMLLADMGAEVVKVEEPGCGDPIRAQGPPWLNGASSYFLSVNRNKRGVALDLRDSRGRATFLSLVRQADVVVDNYRPGVMARLGLTPAELRSANPSVITCSISGFGQTGPYRDLPAFDLVVQAMGGGMSITGEPGRAPVRAGLSIGDLAAGLVAAQGILGALFRRERTGEPEDLDVSLLDVQVALLTYAAQNYWADGVVPGPIGSGHRTAVPYGAFACSDDRYLVLAVFADRFWSPLCDVLGRRDLARRWPAAADRLKARDEIETAVAQALLARPASVWVHALRAAGVPCGPVHDVAGALDDPQVRHRRMVAATEFPHPVAGTHPVLGNPLHNGEETTYAPAPLLGEHTDEVLSTWVGLSAGEIAELRSSGAVA